MDLKGGKFNYFMFFYFRMAHIFWQKRVTMTMIYRIY